MQTEIIISGFGGQGVLFAGQVLSYAAMDNDLHVTWFPSYGPEMRGGTASCTVIISDEEIGAPLAANPRALLALNQPSLDKYEEQVIEDGFIFLNKSLVERDVERKDTRVFEIPANDIAEETGDRRLMNMVMVGALVEGTGVLTLDAVKQALKDHLPERHHKLLPANYKAIDKGAALVRQVLTAA